MARIWANRLEAGDQAWESVPMFRRNAVKEIMQGDVKSGRITAERYKEICGEDFPDPLDPMMGIMGK